jgi:hypothetical protein
VECSTRGRCAARVVHRSGAKGHGVPGSAAGILPATSGRAVELHFVPACSGSVLRSSRWILRHPSAEMSSFSVRAPALPIEGYGTAQVAINRRTSHHSEQRHTHTPGEPRIEYGREKGCAEHAHRLSPQGSWPENVSPFVSENQRVLWPRPAPYEAFERAAQRLQTDWRDGRSSPALTRGPRGDMPDLPARQSTRAQVLRRVRGAFGVGLFIVRRRQCAHAKILRRVRHEALYPGCAPSS